ncbi:MAG TPA: CBS domain-containing protein [Xanthobacteraceae bacterium]|nr:CBS domain-containing protein [Xanthobacteraceae bacterium]
MEEVMRVSDAMTADVRIAKPQQTIAEAARMMAEIDVGALPVGDGDRLVGMLTDRDIAIRAVALGKNPQTPVQDVMSKEVLYCFADQDLDEVVQNMADIKVRRMPVLNRDKRLVGILSLGDVALVDDPDVTGEALCEISEPGGKHSQRLGRDGATPR